MSADAGAVVELVDVAYGYDRELVLDGVSLALHAGRITGFLGRNGAGKSTTIKVIAGALRPTRGRAVIGGAQATSPTARRRVGWAPEEPPLSASVTVAEHVRLAASLAAPGGRTPAQAIAAVGLTEVADRLAGALSKGTKQRVGLAMALVGSPDVLLLDEPSAGLDPAQARALRQLVREEAKRGAAVLWSTHVVSELKELADDVVSLVRGASAFVGPIAALDEAAAAALADGGATS